MTEQAKTFREIFSKYRDKFKTEIKGEFIDILFSEDISKRKELITKHTVANIEPEPLTEDIIIAMFRECGIDPLDIKRQKVLNGVNDIFERVRKKPDFYILNADPNKKGILFEIEHLNKGLEKKGDGEGIEQALEWYKLDPSFAFEYDSIITNFHEWFFLTYNREKRKYEVIPKKPWEALEDITNIKFGRGREYLLELEEQKRDITNQFYNKFQERLKKLLGKASTVRVDIKVLNFKKSEDQTTEEYENDLISFYRIIFSRLLFIKILISWKMLEIDPLSLILKKEMIYWNTELRALFFDIFNKKPENRPKYVPGEFKILPYLNGGLFRPSGIEIDNNGIRRDVHLNPEALKDIWDFLKKFKFIQEDNETEIEDHNTINPEILGYIFERSIGDERKKTGSFYTPEELTDYMTENTIYPYILEKINSRFPKILPIKKISDIDFLLKKVEIYNYILNELIQDIKICDPACGSGAFLKKAADKLLFLYKKCYRGCGRDLPFKVKDDIQKDSQMPFADIYSIKKHIIQNNIYGVDINKSAIDVCELRLWLWIVKPPEELIGSKEYLEIPSLPNIEYNIRCGNSLVGYCEIERLSEIGSDTFHRIDDKFLSKKGSAIIDILHQKQDLISCYYQKDENIEESKKSEIRNAINTIVDDFKEQLNALLKSDYHNQKLVVPLEPLYISKYINDKNFRKNFQDVLRDLNINNELTYFKINFKTPVDIDYEAIKRVKGLTCSVNKNTKKVSSIYPTSSFNIKYFSEYGENPFSKLLPKQVSDWSKVDNIELKKQVGIKDILLIDPFYWIMEFPTIFNDSPENNRGFDIIIGNPPFIRADTEDEFFLLQRKILIQLPEYETLWEKWDIFVAFIERCMKKLLKKNGKFAFVISDAICTVKYAMKIRKWSQNNNDIPFLDYFESYDVFKGVGINPILLFINNTKTSNITNKRIHSENFRNISKEYNMNQDSEYLWKKNVPEILSFNLGNYEKLSRICYISKGMVLNADEQKYKGEFYAADLISPVKTEIHKKLYIDGKDCKRYKITRIRYLEWDTDRCPTKISRKTFKKLYENKKIIRGRMNEGVIDYDFNFVTSANANVLKKFSDLKGVDNKSIRNSIMKHKKKTLTKLALKNKLIDDNNGNDDIIHKLKSKYKGSKYDEVINSIYQKTRKELEDLSNNYEYEYILALLNSKLINVYLNAIRRHKQENYFYPDDFRKLPIKPLEDQTFFVNIVNVLQFLYQYGGNKGVIDFFDNIILNLVIYELYFEDKMKEDGCYYGLLEEIKGKVVKIEFEKWIKLAFKSPLSDEEFNKKNEIEREIVKIINEIYNNLNTESINNKIKLMREFNWINEIESKGP